MFIFTKKNKHRMFHFEPLYVLTSNIATTDYQTLTEIPFLVLNSGGFAVNFTATT